MYFESFDCGPGEFILSVNFFLLKGKDHFCVVVLLFLLLGIIFIQCEYGIG